MMRRQKKFFFFFKEEEIQIKVKKKNEKIKDSRMNRLAK